MNHHETYPVTPSEVWQSKPEEIELDEPIERAFAHMNGKNPEEIMENARDKLERSENGIVYAYLDGENPSEYSNEEAMVIFNPYANGAFPNMLIRAELIREVARQYDIRAEDGKLKPVIMLASPGFGESGSDLRLDKEQRAEVRNGELGPAARELLKVVSQKDIGKVALLGFSQGADMAIAGARSTYSENLDAERIAIGDPATVEERSKPALMKDFSEAGANEFKKSVAETGLDALNAYPGTKTTDFIKFGLYGLKPINQTIYSGLGKNTFEARMQELIDEGKLEKAVVAYGGDSEIAKPHNIEPILERIYDRNGAESLVSIRVNGANHTWGDQLKLLSKLYMRALK